MRGAGPLLGILLVAPAASASAQAWTPDAGSGAISVQYQNDLVRYHAGGTTLVDAGHIQTHEAVADMVYGVTDRLAVRFTIPYIVSKYHGNNPHKQIQGLEMIDNDHYHGAVQDLRLDVRFAITPHRLLAVTPFATAIVPSHQYPYFAHSAVGSDLNELQVGSYVARTLDPIAPQLFVQARVAYGFVQPMIGYSHDRTYLDLELGYSIRPGIRVFLLGTGFTTHGGINLPSAGAYTALESIGGDELWRHHDQIGHEKQVDLGFGGAIAITSSLDVFGSIGTNMMEVNGHVMDHGLALGLTWHFSRNGDVLGDLSEGPRKMAARCVCGKAR